MITSSESLFVVGADIFRTHHLFSKLLLEAEGRLRNMPQRERNNFSQHLCISKEVLKVGGYYTLLPPQGCA